MSLDEQPFLCRATELRTQLTTPKVFDDGHSFEHIFGSKDCIRAMNSVVVLKIVYFTHQLETVATEGRSEDDPTKIQELCRNLWKLTDLSKNRMVVLGFCKEEMAFSFFWNLKACRSLPREKQGSKKRIYFFFRRVQGQECTHFQVQQVHPSCRDSKQ